MSEVEEGKCAEGMVWRGGRVGITPPQMQTGAKAEAEASISDGMRDLHERSWGFLAVHNPLGHWEILEIPFPKTLLKTPPKTPPFPFTAKKGAWTWRVESKEFHPRTGPRTEAWMNRSFPYPTNFRRSSEGLEIQTFNSDAIAIAIAIQTSIAFYSLRQARTKENKQMYAGRS